MNSPRNPGDEPRQPVGTTVTTEGVPQLIGASIGPYRLMEKIGEGGFGLVFVAEQQRPVKRKVALKVIKPGMDSREVIARFEAERQALALMEHPNIARVFDAGTTDSGHPYFVMELVRGVTITDYCDKNRLTLRERLELFITVCQAIQHAHQKGIIHRDIKPSNVLVTLHDGSPVAKVIDFGVAKALHQQLTEKTIYTRFAQVIGTPLYMSPEQAEMSGLDIDTRSDIYSLGVLLYELLTGTTPFDGRRLAKLAFDERIRIIRNEEPPKPSTRLRQSSETLPSIAAQRRVEPSKLSKLFRGDLDWITMRALEKDRTRRYPTASALAADVLRYLRDEPVEASPPSATYLLSKFARRYRTLLATATAFFALLLVGVVASTTFWIREKSARDFAEQMRRKADDEAKSARSAQAEAETEKGRALAAESKAVAAQKAVEEAYDRSQRSLYLSGIALAERNWEGHNPRRTREVLAQCPEKFRDWEWNYLNQLAHSEVMTLPGENATYSPDGAWLATSDGDADAPICIRDARSGKVLIRLKGERPIPFLQSLVFSPDSHRIAAICQDRAVRIWSLPAGLRTLELNVRLNEETLQTPLGHPIGLAFSPNGKRIALAGIASEKPNDAGVFADNLQVLDVNNGKELFTVSDTGRSVAFRPDGHELATTSCKLKKEDGNSITEGIRILNANNGVVLRQFDPWRPPGFAPPHLLSGIDDSYLTYSPDGKWLASARWGEIKIWEASSRKEVRTLHGHERPINGLCFSADGKRMASASSDESVRMWDTSNGEALAVYRGHTGAVARVSFRADDKLVVSTGEDRTLRIWDAMGERGSGWAAVKGKTACFAVSPDGRHAAYIRGEGQPALVLIDAVTGRDIQTLRALSPSGNSVYGGLAFSSDGRLLASTWKKEVQVWDVVTGHERAQLPGVSDHHRRGLAFSPDGRRLAFTGPQNSVEIWDIQDQHQLATFKGHKDLVTTIAFSPNGEWVASGSTEGTVKVWNAANGQEICSLIGTPSGWGTVAFSPDGRHLLTSGSDNSVRVWDLAKRAEERALRGHKAAVRSIAFNPTGTRLVTAGSDLVTRLWTWPEGEEILSLPVRFEPIFAGFIAGGRQVAAAGVRGDVTVWNATPGASLEKKKE